jgi:dihydroorotase
MKNTLTVAGTCVNPEGSFNATLTIEDKIITKIEDYRKENVDIVASDLIFPGFLDVHVHGREDVTGEDCYKEDFKTLGEAAVNGGVVHVAEMGNNPCPPIDARTYTEKSHLTLKSEVPITLYAMIGPGTNPLAGINAPYKLCHARTTGKNDIIFFPTRDQIMETARNYVGCHVSQHCEDLEIIAVNEKKETHELRRPPAAEESSITLALWLIEHVFGKGKLCHCSVWSGIHKIERAKARGVQVMCEITPHHLYFDDSMINDENRPWMQMNPPLRSPQSRWRCIEYLREGVIDMIATDHAPHTTEDKLSTKGASGQPHLDTLGPFTTWLMVDQKFEPEDIARICSTKPAEFLNPYVTGIDRPNHGYGRIAPGYIGSLTLINRKAPITITKDILKTKCKWSPFEGVKFPGSVEATIVRGKVLKYVK